MKPSTWKSIGLSAFLHLIVLALAFYGIPHESKKLPPKPVWVELSEPRSETGPNGQDSGSQTPEKFKHPSEVPLKKPARSAKNTPSVTPPVPGAPDLALRSRDALRERWLEGETLVVPAPGREVPPGADGIAGTERRPIGSDPMESVGPSGQGWSAGVQYGNAMDLVFVNENLHYFQALHRRIDGALVYREDFVRARMGGKIRIEAVMSRDGRLLDLNGAKADNDVLHAYVLTLLIHLLREPLPERAWLNADKAVVVFDFDFHIRVEGNSPATMEKGVRKNQLLFAREGLVDPWLNEKIQEVFTHYVPPIIPIPGGFYVDFIAAYKFVKNVMEDAPLESEARQARIRLLHKELLQTIRSGAPKREDLPPEQGS